MVNEICFSDVLLESGMEIFETMAFMSMERVSEPNLKIEGDSLLASITFKGDIEGCLAICCGLPCARAITANMLASEAEQEISPEDISDAFGEMVNMVVGSVKSRIHESIGALQISIPTVISGHELASGLGRTNKVSVEVIIDNNYPARLSLWYGEASDVSERN